MTIRSKLNTEVEDVFHRVAWAPVLNSLGKATAGVLFAVLFGSVACQNLGLAPGLGLIAGVVTLVIVAAYWEQRVLNRYSEYLKARFSESVVLERLALGAEHVAEIHDHTPRPWRIMLGSRPDTIPRAASLVVYNLDWYLQPPRRYIDPLWVVNLVLLVLMISTQAVIFALMQVKPYPAMTSMALGELSVLIMVVYLWSMAYGMQKGKIRGRVMLDELQARFKAE